MLILKIGLHIWHCRKYFLLSALIAICWPKVAFCSSDTVKQEMTAAVNAVRPALIRIHVVSATYSQGRESKVESSGSGVIISPDGYAITNHHVAGDAERIVCTLADKKELEAKLIGTDPLSDIAVIKLISPDKKPFPFAKFGDSSKIEVGDRVFAMGCPYAISQSVTMGIISNNEMIMPDLFEPEDFTLEGEEVGSIVRWIGHDAQIEPGNSGGPLVNKDGEIIGINEISLGLSGAIPSNLAKDVANQLINKGKVTRSWIGIQAQPVLESSKLKKGVLIGSVMEGSPAAAAGIKPGDVMLNLDGKDITVLFKEEVPIFNQFVASIPVGKKITATILRDGKEIKLDLTTAERQKAMDKQHELKSWGICATNITYSIQKEMKRESQDGVLVESVLPSGPAGSAKPSIREGDIITKVGNEHIKDLAHLRSITNELIKGKKEAVPVIVHFDRKSRQYATVVSIGKKEESEPGREIRKAWLAIDLQAITRELAKAYGMPEITGVRVTQVHKGGNAEKAGIKVGDLIVKLDGEPIPADQDGDEEVLPSLIRQYDIGSEVNLTVLRDSKEMQVKVILEASPKPERDYPTFSDDNFEFTARDIAFSDRANGNVEIGQEGVYVQSVSEGSWASLGNLKSGDVITEIDNIKITSLEDLKKIMKEIQNKKPEAVVFKVLRGIHTKFLEIKPLWQE